MVFYMTSEGLGTLINIPLSSVHGYKSWQSFTLGQKFWICTSSQYPVEHPPALSQHLGNSPPGLAITLTTPPSPVKAFS